MSIVALDAVVSVCRSGEDIFYLPEVDASRRMRRRDLLGALAATTVTGLAGCPAAGDGDGSADCATPGGDLTAALPQEDEYSDPSVDQNNSAEEVGGATQNVLASYQTDSGTYLFVIGQYDSEQAARDAATDRETWESYSDGVVGSLVVDTYAYVAMGPKESDVRDLMARAGPLNEACIEDNITIL